MSSPKPKRPGGKKHDSFFHKIHKRHDQRHHGDESDHHHADERPLLQEEHPDTASEIEAQSVVSEPSRSARVREAFNDAGQWLLRQTQNASSTVATEISRGGNAVKTVLSDAGTSLKNNPKRTLSAACGLLALLVTGETADIIMHHPLPSSNTGICLTPACVGAAAQILNNLHPLYQQLDPCTNFEQYVCGGFRMNHELRQSQSSIFTGTLAQEEVNAALRHVLEMNDEDFKEKDKTIFRKIRDAYTACMDEEKIKDYGMKPLQGIIDDIRRHFISDSTTLRKSSTFQVVSSQTVIAPDTLTNPLTYMAKLNIDALVSLDVEANGLQPETQTMTVRPALPVGLPLSKQYWDQGIVSQYAKAIESSIGQVYDLPGNKSTLHSRYGIRTSPKDLTRGILQLETRLATIVPSEADTTAPTKPIPLTLDEIEDILPQISIGKMMHELGPSDSNITVLATPSVRYLRDLSKLLAATQADVLQAFLVWKAVQAYSFAIDHEAVNQWKRLENVLEGKDPNTHADRWLTCVESVNADFQWVLSKFYVERHFSLQSKLIGEEVVANVAQSFGGIIATSSWMTESERSAAMLKLASIKYKVGFPSQNPDIRDSAWLEAFYANVYVQNNTHFENKIQTARAKSANQWSKLGQHTDRDEWELASTVVAASYDVQRHDIFLPAAIMHKPMIYESDVPASFTYGAFGALVGHEITHAFDQTGSHYTANGTLGEWWSNNTRAAFEKETTCFANQYSSYAVQGPDGPIYTNGSLALGQSVADSGGAHAAYNAFVLQQEHNVTKLLPGLSMFTQKQLFWLSYGNWWCSKATPESLAHKILVDPYLPESVRIKGAVANSIGFREAFNCAEKQPVCKIW